MSTPFKCYYCEEKFVSAIPIYCPFCKSHRIEEIDHFGFSIRSVLLEPMFSLEACKAEIGEKGQFTEGTVQALFEELERLRKVEVDYVSLRNYTNSVRDHFKQAVKERNEETEKKETLQRILSKREHRLPLKAKLKK